MTNLVVRSIIRTMDNKRMRTKVIGYCRVSTEDQVRHGVSLDAQKAKIAAWAEANDAELLAVHVDEGISGHRTANRPGLQAALVDACREKAALVVLSLSRLARNTKEALELSERLDKCGADLVSLTEKIDTTSAAGKMVFRLLSVLAEFERDLVAERTKSAMAYARSQGRCVGNVPYGYDEVDGRLIENETEQKALQFIILLRERGFSLRKIGLELQNRDIKTKMGKTKWHPKVIRGILQEA